MCIVLCLMKLCVGHYTVTGEIYLNMLSEWLMSHTKNSGNFVPVQDWVPPHGHNKVKNYQYIGLGV